MEEEQKKSQLDRGPIQVLRCQGGYYVGYANGQPYNMSLEYETYEQAREYLHRMIWVEGRNGTFLFDGEIIWCGFSRNI